MALAALMLASQVSVVKTSHQAHISMYTRSLIHVHSTLAISILVDSGPLDYAHDGSVLVDSSLKNSAPESYNFRFFRSR